MPTKRLQSYLEDHHIQYQRFTHQEAYTAQEIAAVTHTKGDGFAKTVMLKIDGCMAMAVLPSSYTVDFSALEHLDIGDNVRLANEMEFKDKFPECEVGAMPPFGNLYNMPVYTSESLMKDKQITFNAGTHHEVITMNTTDYVDLVNPTTIRFSRKRKS